MDIQNSVALVTGANRGFGRHLAAELLSRGAAKVYAAARNPSTVDLPGAVPLRLDITDPDSVARAAQAAPDVTLLINNAGISTHAGLVNGDMADIRLEMETHFFGSLNVTRAFAPVLTANGGGAVLNVLSVLSWAHYPAYGGYSSAKAAEWAMTDVVRQELAPAGIDVTALHVGYMDTDMAHYVESSDKVDPAKVAVAALDGIEARALEVIADDKSLRTKAALSGDPGQLYPGLPVRR
ncbi:SDR family oxidoreductase [Streptomyces sp. AK02-01A]|uniref:SDR family oxidoreductase n=1 Tax=Streptomyces sp. AK02-01A TaxID=3028648 RepID=UPI0029AD97BF|nr:SDR family oxidoreductase [Streptomyces sp. AK02-01A]MDX3853064.1 SDR family oxidoreductase [Streptomyces sp. AK02-01A]